MSADVVDATYEYETWLRANIPLVNHDLERKHTEMAASSMRFLRGTYYWWLLRFSEQLPELLELPAVPVVGDLHVENFGTWRDHRGRRRWGVNDLDELAWGSPALDLVRLTTSASLVEGITLSTKALSRHILDAWQSAKPGVAARITTQPHLRALMPVARSAKRFFAALETGEHAPGVPQRVAIAVQHTVSAPDWQPTWHRRTAGTGSLGHQRVVAVGRDGAARWHAREAKQLGPSTVEWLGERAHLPVLDELLYGRVQNALRGPHPSRRVAGWQIRSLAPDVARIELAGLRKRDVLRVIASMAEAVADVHGVDRAARRRAFTVDELREAVEVMRADTLAAHAAWRAHVSAHG